MWMPVVVVAEVVVAAVAAAVALHFEPSCAAASTAMTSPQKMICLDRSFLSR